MALGIFKGPGIGSTHLLFSISVLFRSVPLQFHSIERRLNRKGTGLEWEWNGMVMERELSGNGTGAKREWNGNGTKIQWSDNECSVHGAWTVI